jgi:DNA-binding response OmpR family regulator/signal transduction histidine kinase
VGRAAAEPAGPAAVTVATLAALATQLNDALALVAPDETVREVSPALAALIGREPAALRGLPADQLLRHLATLAERQDDALAELATFLRASERGAQALILPLTTGGRLALRGFPLPVAAEGGTWRVLHLRASTTAGPDAGPDAGRERGGLPPDPFRLLTTHVQAPLANLRAAATSLLTGVRRWEPAAQQEMLRVITHEAELVHAAVTTLEELVRLERGEARLHLAAVELSDLLMTVLASWKPAAPLHSFELAMPGEVPPVTADEERIKRAINLLLEQAVHLTASGGTVRVDIRPQAEAVVLSVRQQGCAVAADELERMFEPFYRLRAAPDVQVSGGAGLALARALIRAHGGRIWAETSPAGDGTVCYIAVPYLPIPPCPPTTPVAAPLPLGGPAVAAPPLAGPRARRVALVLDGDPRMLRYVRANLDAQQFRTVTSGDAAEFLRLVDLEDPDLVLLDTSVPGGDLEEVLHQLRLHARAPVIMLARRHDPEECARSLDLGATDYLAKPFAMEELLARIRAALRTRDALVRAAERKPVFEHDGLMVDFEQRRVAVDGVPVALSKTEFKLLRTLAQHPNMVLSHDVLLERVWGPGYSHEVEFVWVYVRRLRRKIEPDPARPRYILTVPGVGYRLACD